MEKLITIVLGLVLAGTVIMAASVFSGLNDGRVETAVGQLVKGAK
jgi:hypothetical protein